MNPGTVESALDVVPPQPVELTWSENLDELTVAPKRRWRTDETYPVVIGGTARAAMASRCPRPPATRSRPRPRPPCPISRYASPSGPAAGRADENAKLMAADVLDADALSGKAIDALPPTPTAKAVSPTSTITVSFSEQWTRPM